MKTYTHCITVNLDIQANSEEEAEQKFSDMLFAFTDRHSGDPYDFNFETCDVICYDDESEQLPPPAYIDVPTIEPFDKHRGFESVDEAVEYCKQFNDPEARMLDIAHANIDAGEFGFAYEICQYI